MKTQRIELFKQDGQWKAYFKNVENIPNTLIPTPFNDSTPYEIVKNKIKSLNPQCKVV